MRVCPHCKSILVDSAKICANCGKVPYPMENSQFLESTPMRTRKDLECLKCGSRKDLSTFSHRYIIQKGSSSTYGSLDKSRNFSIPVCTQCYSKFHAWTNSHKSQRSRLSYFNHGSFIILFLIIGTLVSYFYNIILGILIFSLIVLNIGYAIYKSRVRQDIDSPFRYVRFSGKKVLVRPRGTGNWIIYDKWLKSVNQEE